MFFKHQTYFTAECFFKVSMLKEVYKRLSDFNPSSYASTRNFENGSCSELSAYIARGIISPRQIMETLQVKGYTQKEWAGFLQQMAWREYFQRVLQYNPRLFETALLKDPDGTYHRGIPVSVINAQTKITALDRALKKLYNQGHIHNHLRLYLAALICNVARVEWQSGARWMYYYLLDADLASNYCSWQWVCGASRNQKYYAHQHNINFFCNTQDAHTLLDVPMEAFPFSAIPESLQLLEEPQLYSPCMPENTLKLNPDWPVCVYTPYNLDPLWRKNIASNRVLFLDAQWMEKFPMCSHTLEFIQAAGKEIPGIQFFWGSAKAFMDQIARYTTYQKEHPVVSLGGISYDSRDWLFSNGYEPGMSFFKFWNAVKSEWGL